MSKYSNINFWFKLLVSLVVVLVVTSCVRKGYQDKEWSTFDFSAQQWLEQVRSLPAKDALTFQLPEQLNFVKHGNTQDKAEFTVKSFADPSSENPAAPHVGISGVIQGDKLGMLVYYSNKEKDLSAEAPDTVQNLKAILLSLTPSHVAHSTIRDTVLEVISKAKKSTLSMAQSSVGEIQISLKYGKLSLRNSLTNQDESIDSVVVSFCNGEDCK